MNSHLHRSFVVLGDECARVSLIARLPVYFRPAWRDGAVVAKALEGRDDSVVVAQLFDQLGENCFKLLQLPSPPTVMLEEADLRDHRELARAWGEQGGRLEFWTDRAPSAEVDGALASFADDRLRVVVCVRRDLEGVAEAWRASPLGPCTWVQFLPAPPTSEFHFFATERGSWWRARSWGVSRLLTFEDVDGGHRAPGAPALLETPRLRAGVNRLLDLRRWSLRGWLFVLGLRREAE